MPLVIMEKHDNHSVAYCLLGYLCAYYRHYHPLEFLTAFLNNAANEEDIRNGTTCAKQLGIAVTNPKWGVSKSDYFFDAERNAIAKGMESIKYLNAVSAEELYNLSHNKKYVYFMDVLTDIDKHTSLNTRQLDILIKLDFFSEFGNQRELLHIVDAFYNKFKRGEAKQISKEKVKGTPIEGLIEQYSVGFTKNGAEAKNYTILDMHSVLIGVEQIIRNVGYPDLDDMTKVRNFKEAMGYIGYVSGKEEDRRKLYVLDIYPLERKKDHKQFGYSVITKSIGSGKEARFTVFNRQYDNLPIHKDDIIIVQEYERDGVYFTLTKYTLGGRAS